MVFIPTNRKMFMLENVIVGGLTESVMYENYNLRRFSLLMKASMPN